MSKRMVLAGKLKGNNGTLVVDKWFLMDASSVVVPEALLDNLLAFSKVPGQTTMWFDPDISMNSVNIGWEHEQRDPFHIP